MRSQQCIIQWNYDLHTETTSVQRPLFSGPYVVVIDRFHSNSIMKISMNTMVASNPHMIFRGRIMSKEDEREDGEEDG